MPFTYPDRATINVRATTTDNRTGMIETWNPVATNVPCWLRDRQGAAAMNAQQEIERVNVHVHFPSPPKTDGGAALVLTNNHQIVAGGRTILVRSFKRPAAPGMPYIARCEEQS